MAERPFTTRFPITLLRELEHAAKELGLKKKDILIEAFTMWNKERQQNCLTKIRNEDNFNEIL